MRSFWVVGLVFLAGCVPYSAIEASLKRSTAPDVGCPEDQVVISSYEQGAAGMYPSRWTATGCGREWRCELHVGSATSGSVSRQACTETAASNAETLRQVVLDRLSLETGCAPELVAVTKEADWSRGGEKAYRMTACGKAYVCTTAAGRTDCKAALGE